MNTTGCNEISDALLRAGIFRLFAEAFCYPEQDSLEVLESRWISLLGWKGEWPDVVQDSLAGTLEDLRAANPSLLSDEYFRLFGPAACCPLTETSWGDSGRLLGKAAQLADISGFYHAFKVQPRAIADSVPEDHLVVELEFMSILYLKEAYAANAGLNEELDITRDAQKKFLEEHLATWIDYWAELLGNYAPRSFYHTLASALQITIRSEARRLGITPVPIRARVTDHEAGADSFNCPLVVIPGSVQS
jgi:TorA maturation chaperone TorD